MKKYFDLLDPENAQSAIYGHVSPPRIDKSDKSNWRMEGHADVTLTDCTKAITWDMCNLYPYGENNRGYSVEKITKAIDILWRMREEMERCQEKFLELRKEVVAHNKLEKAKRKGKKKDASERDSFCL